MMVGAGVITPARCGHPQTVGGSIADRPLPGVHIDPVGVFDGRLRGQAGASFRKTGLAVTINEMLKRRSVAE